jgi:V/A-type H+/Na+-transporting ATPase subunit I
MIVPMKKVFLLLLDSEKTKSLNMLKKIGLVHLQDIQGSGEKFSFLQNQRDMVISALSKLPEMKKKSVKDVSYGREETLEISKRIININDEIKTLSDNIQNIDKEIERIKIWGDYKPEDINLLRSNGVNIKLFEFKKSVLKELPDNITIFNIANLKSVGYYAVISNNFDAFEKFEEIQIPAKGLSELYDLREITSASKNKYTKELETLSAGKLSLMNLLTTYNEEVEFENVYSGLSVDESIAYLQGYIPSDKTDLIKKEASANDWGIMLQEPVEEDHVPTLIKNSKIVKIIQPVFNFLGTVPGYREKDISLFFLIFLSFFTAMIIGDAGYGAIFLIVSIYAGVKSNKKTGTVPDAIKLFTLMGILTIIWGTISGTWFGSELISELPFFKIFIIDSIASFSKTDTSQLIMHMCFIIGLVHLSIAHIWNFIAMLKDRPLIKAFAQPGWLSMIIGLYFLVLNLVLGSNNFPLPAFALYMIIGGLGFVVIFSEQEGNFFKGILKGISGLLTTFLDSISAFSDIISYIRLFAVGLATVAVASSFNSMAAGMGTGVIGIIAAIFILAIGHTLNIAMVVLSVVVHGIRLNVLEFSGHLGMEWTGEYYTPFKNREDI